MKSQKTSSGKKTQVVVITCLKALPPDMSWNNVKAVLWQQFSLVSVVTQVASQCVHKYQQKGESLQGFNFELVNLFKQLQIVNQRIKSIH